MTTTDRHDLRATDLLHFAGVGGSGMSALAQFHVWSGGRATGSDRAFDQGRHPDIRAALEAAGVVIAPQDGSGLTPEHAALVVSTAVEDEVPDVQAARALGSKILHRSDLLAHWVRSYRTIAVTGTSGKSTVVAMIFEILAAAGQSPNVITGGNLRALQAEALLGNAFSGGGELLVIEADESDGSLVRYAPAVGVILNLQRDHKEPEVVFEMFRTFRAQTREALVVGEAANLDGLVTVESHAGDVSLEGATRVGSGAADGQRGALSIMRYGSGEHADWRAIEVKLEPACSRFVAVNAGRASGADRARGAGRARLPESRGPQRAEHADVVLPTPGMHNVENAIAAMAAVHAVGIDLRTSARALATFQGVARRFQSIGRTDDGIEVIDDFAHNPAKITASLRTAHLRAERVLAIFQPHGFGPTRFIRDDLVAELAREMRPEERIWLPEIFYAGGTVTKDLSSADLVADLLKRGVQATFVADRSEIVPAVAREARAGDLVLVMGARDPSLTAFARSIFARIVAMRSGS